MRSSQHDQEHNAPYNVNKADYTKRSPILGSKAWTWPVEMNCNYSMALDLDAMQSQKTKQESGFITV